MRRRSPGVTFKDKFLVERIEALERDDPERVIRTLEPFVGERRRARIQAVLAERLASVVVAFESPHDPHNGAAVIRSCEAFGVQTLHVLEQNERFVSAGAVSKSAEKWIDVVTHPTNVAGAAAIRAQGYEMVATHPDGSLLPADLASIPRLCIVLGNERDGIGADLMEACTRAVRVPMRGFVESLNVSVTAAILLSAATAGRQGDLPEHDRRRLYARGLYLSAPHADLHLRDL
jgi:tRNA (guanosine-2'-O-)-methyltransferase